jgi:Putative peptidoglycan binding domain
VVGAALLVAAVAAVVAVVLAVRGGGGAGGTGSETQAGTSLATVTRRELTSQTQVDGTLGYSGSSTIVVPGGTAPSALRQAQQSVAAAQATLRAAETTLAVDTHALEQAQATLAADRQAVATACGGDSAAQSASGGGGGSDPNASSPSSDSSTPCATAAQSLASDEAAVSTAENKVKTDTGSVESARVALDGAEQTVAASAPTEVFYESGAVYTTVPSSGDVIRRGRALYAVADQPVLLMYGGVTAWRAFRSGMSAGRDVAELNANLRALGFGDGLTGDSFTDATAAAIRELQASRGLPQTGALLLGSVVFRPTAVRVKTVAATRGAAVQPGPAVTVSSTRHQVTVSLDAAQQAEVQVGDKVTITLPDNSTTPGVVSKVGSVASQGGQDSSPTVEVDIRLSKERAAGRLDGAPVQVEITTGSVDNALAVPVDALLALAGGGYAVEVVDPSGTHRLLAVTTGLFDDAEGLVQVSGSQLRAGQRVVVPSS